MSGHSKWSTIKRQKQAQDQARGQIFTKLGNAITIAVREGGGITDPQGNIKLRLAIDKAREANMPKSNIDRAILRASPQESHGQELEYVVYEGFGPGGVAAIAEGITDNKQRTSQEVKNTFFSHGGNLGGSGSVRYLFDRVGEIEISKNNLSYEKVFDIASQIGAQDVEEGNDNYTLYCQPEKLHEVKKELDVKQIPLLFCDLTYRPKTLVDLSTQVNAQIINLLTSLESLADIHKVFTNANLK